jgi:hypothetical protein
MTKTLKFIVQKEGKYYVSQCLNVDISSFGNTVQEAIDNLNEALRPLLRRQRSFVYNHPYSGNTSTIIRQSGLSVDDFFDKTRKH